MKPLVKKEIRLLLPSWIAAVLLAMVQGITRPYDFYVASLLFFGLTILALTTFGREASLNTFSSLLAQPAERIRIWQTKLSVLAVAFLIVFVVWLAAFGIAFFNSNVDFSDRNNSYNLFITICLIAAATFTGGLWTTLLLRQLAGAFWLTLLVPAVLSGFFAVFLVDSQSSSLVIAVLSVVIAVYSVGGFLFARWLFFRAQDVGWSGGIIAMPEWKFLSARSENAVLARNRKPVFALVKKEFQLQQFTLMGAAGLLVMHLGVIVLRKYHHFDKDSAGEVLTSIFWMLWLVTAPVIGSMAVAEERRLGVMEGQLCLTVSRRIQFGVKAVFTLGLGIFLGGVMPMLLEQLAACLGAQNLSLKPADGSGIDIFWLSFFVVSVATWLTLLGFFGSTLSRSFLQAVGFGIATFFISCTALTFNWQDIFHGFLPAQRLLPMILAVPTLIITLLWLAYLNFKNFRPGWALWRRNLLGFAGAVIFVIVMSSALYNRVWEVLEPAEPAHGPAKLSLANPPSIQMVQYYNLLVRLPDGRVWFDRLGDSAADYDHNEGPIRWKHLWQLLAHPLPESIGPQRFASGSNWVTVVTGFVFLGNRNSNITESLWGYLDTVGLQPDGSLWVSDKSQNDKWSSENMQRFGDETNWQQVAVSRSSLALLKSDGTLWQWGFWGASPNTSGEIWPGLRAFTPVQIGTNSDWKELFSLGGLFVYARQADGRVWRLDDKNLLAIQEMGRAPNFDEIIFKTASSMGQNYLAFVRPDGTLWVLNRYWDETRRLLKGTGVLQVGNENDWRAVAVHYDMMVALKAEGSLWQWNFREGNIVHAVKDSPTRLGIHNDWVAIKGSGSDVIALAGDGSLWLWPDINYYDSDALLIKLPKQPQPLGNIFSKPD